MDNQIITYDTKIKEIYKKYHRVLNYMKTKDEFKKLYESLNNKRLSVNSLLKLEEVLAAIHSKIRKKNETNKCNSKDKNSLKPSDSNNGSDYIINNSVSNSDFKQINNFQNKNKSPIINSSVEIETNSFNTQHKAIEIPFLEPSSSEIENHGVMFSENNNDKVCVKMSLIPKRPINIINSNSPINHLQVNPTFSPNKQSNPPVKTDYPFVALKKSNQCSLYDTVKKDKLMLDCRMAHLKHGTVLDLVNDGVRKSVLPKKKKWGKTLNKSNENANLKSNSDELQNKTAASGFEYFKPTILLENDNLISSDSPTSSENSSRGKFPVSNYLSSSNEPKENFKRHGSHVSYNLYLTQSNSNLNSADFTCNYSPQPYCSVPSNNQLGPGYLNSFPGCLNTDNYVSNIPFNGYNLGNGQSLLVNHSIARCPDYCKRITNDFQHNFCRNNQNTSCKAKPFNNSHKGQFRHRSHITDPRFGEPNKQMNYYSNFKKYPHWNPKLNPSVAESSINATFRTNKRSENKINGLIESFAKRRKCNDSSKQFLNHESNKKHFETIPNVENNLPHIPKVSENTEHVFSGRLLDKHDTLNSTKTIVVISKNCESNDSPIEVSYNKVNSVNNTIPQVNKSTKKTNTATNNVIDDQYPQLQNKSEINEGQLTNNVESCNVQTVEDNTQGSVDKLPTKYGYSPLPHRGQTKSSRINECLDANKNIDQLVNNMKTKSNELKQQDKFGNHLSCSNVAASNSLLLGQILNLVTCIKDNPDTLKNVCDILSLVSKTISIQETNKECNQPSETVRNKEDIVKPQPEDGISNIASQDSLVEKSMLCSNFQTTSTNYGLIHNNQNNDSDLCHIFGREKFSNCDEVDDKIPSLHDEPLLMDENKTCEDDTPKYNQNKMPKSTNPESEEVNELKINQLLVPKYSTIIKTYQDLYASPYRGNVIKRSTLRSGKMRNVSGAIPKRKYKRKHSRILSKNDTSSTNRMTCVNNSAFSKLSTVKEENRQLISSINPQTVHNSPSISSHENKLNLPQSGPGHIPSLSNKNVLSNRGSVKIVDVFSISELGDDSQEEYDTIVHEFLSSIDEQLEETSSSSTV